MISIIVKTQFEWCHKWENAPEPVKYLRDLHRHIFYVNSKIEVKHDDRELEFILVKHFINSVISDICHNCPQTFSCEQIASYIKNKLLEKYGQRKISISVFEDNENGAIVED